MRGLGQHGKDLTKTHALAYTITIPRTSSGTPYRWLYNYGITNGYEAADTTDTDSDGFFTWQEWIAYTDPTTMVFSSTGPLGNAGMKNRFS